MIFETTVESSHFPIADMNEDRRKSRTKSVLLQNFAFKTSPEDLADFFAKRKWGRSGTSPLTTGFSNDQDKFATYN